MITGRRKKRSSQPSAQVTLRQYDLVPDEFREEISAQQVRCGWVVTLALMATVLGHLLFTDWVQAEAARRYEELIRTRVEPVLQARSAAQSQSEFNERHARWLRQVESARPDDSLVQTLAAITASIGPLAGEVALESIDAQLPTEFVATAVEGEVDVWESAPEHAKPAVVIRARCLDADAANALLLRLRDQPRFLEAVIESQAGTVEPPLIEVRAVPRATRTLP